MRWLLNGENEIVLDLSEISNEDLLDYFTLFVEVEWYDPVKTPEMYIELRNKGVSSEVLKKEIIKRIS